MMWHNMPGSSCRLCLSHTIAGESPMGPSLLGTISRPMSSSSFSLISTNQGMLFTQIKFSCSAWEIPHALPNAFPKREAFVFLSSITVSLCSQTAPCQQPFIKSSTQPQTSHSMCCPVNGCFPVKQHCILYKEAQSKQQSKESWKQSWLAHFLHFPRLRATHSSHLDQFLLVPHSKSVHFHSSHSKSYLNFLFFKEYFGLLF